MGIVLSIIIIKRKSKVIPKGPLKLVKIELNGYKKVFTRKRSRESKGSYGGYGGT